MLGESPAKLAESSLVGFDWVRPDFGDWPDMIGGLASALVAVVAVLVSARMARLAVETQERTSAKSVEGQRAIAVDDRVWIDKKAAYEDVIEWTLRASRMLTAVDPDHEVQPKPDLERRLELFGSRTVTERFKEAVAVYGLWTRFGRQPDPRFLRAHGDDQLARGDWRWQVLENLGVKPRVLYLRHLVRAEIAHANTDDREATIHDVSANVIQDNFGLPTEVRIDSWTEHLD